MQDTIAYIIKNIVTIPDEVQVDESVDETGTTTYAITVNPADVGRIIGKEGKVIKAIRTIMRVIAIQQGVHIRISVVSDDAPVSSETVAQEAPLQAEAADVVATQDTPEEDSLSVEV